MEENEILYVIKEARWMIERSEQYTCLNCMVAWLESEKVSLTYLANKLLELRNEIDTLYQKISHLESLAKG